MEGNESGVFGGVEFLKTLNWSALAATVAAAVALWAKGELLPLLESQGGVWTLVAGGVAAVVGYFVHKNADNTK